MPITDLSDEELMNLYKPQNEQSSGISSISDEELMKMYQPEQTQQVLTGGIEQRVIPNWDKKGRIYYTDEQGNRIKSNVPLSRKLANKVKATTTNIGDWLTTDVGEKAKERRKAVALLTTAPIGMGAGIGGMALTGALGGGLYSGAEQAIEGKFNPKQLATDIALGSVTGGLLGLGGKYIVSPIVKNISRRADIAKRRSTPLAERMTEEQLDNIQNIQQPQIVEEVTPQVTKETVEKVTPQAVEETIEQPKINLNTLKSNIRNNKFEQSNMKDYYAITKGKKGYKSTLADPISYDMELSQREFNKIITEISKNPEKLNDEVYVADLVKRVQDIVDRTPYGYEKEVAYPYWEKFWKAIDDGYSYNEFKANRGKAPKINKKETTPTNIIDETIQQVEKVEPQAIGETKLRLLPQSVLEAKGTPKEVKEIIKKDMPTYQVLHNEDIINQASNEIAGNFDNELVRLASAKDFDALDYEKSRQIAKTLFDMGDYQKAVDLIDNVAENATKKGQAIQALSLWSNMSPEGAVYKAQKLVKEYNKKNPKKPIQLTDENIDTIRKLQSEALNTTDELERNQAMARSAKYTTDLIPKGFVKKLKAYRNISMLLNPKTLGRNVVGNVAFNAIDTLSKGLAVPIDKALSIATKQRTRVAPNLGTYGKGLLQGAKTGYKEALQGIDTRGLGQRYDLGSGRVFESKPMQALETMLDVGLRVPDRAFYEATFAESVENMMKAQGLKEPTQEILERAEQEALESVFQNKSKISDFALDLRGGLNRIGTQDFGLGDVLIPYAQTPANLTQQAINYSPLGAVKGLYNLSQGSQRQASLDIARSLIGSGLISGGYGLAKAGLTTPSQFDENYTRNKAIRENLQPLGIRPDQLGNMWYAPFQPMSSPIATGTAMAYGENPLFAGLNTVVDQPYLQGVARGLRDLQEGNWTDAGINVASSIPSQFVPTFASQIAQSIDPYQRQTYDPDKLKYGLNSAIAKIPFASKTLPEKIDVTGQPVERYSSEGATRLFDIFLNPTFINKKTDDPVLSELKYIYDQTKETKHFMPTVDRTLSFTDVDGNKQKIKLTGRELSEYQRELGQRMYDEFNYVMDLPEYTNTDDYGKIKLLEKAKELVKDEVDNEMWNKKKAYKKSSYTRGY
ncbi:MAG: hypothetical protein ACI4S3_06110 [Candidatus Gastranaerophilaceae bacterium]